VPRNHRGAACDTCGSVRFHLDRPSPARPAPAGTDLADLQSRCLDRATAIDARQPADIAAVPDWIRGQAPANAEATAVESAMQVLHGSVRWRWQSDGHQTVSDESKLLPELLRGHADKNSRTGGWSAFRGPAWVHLVVRNPQFERRGRPGEPLLCER
jgi:hypothetical protein